MPLPDPFPRQPRVHRRCRVAACLGVLRRGWASLLAAVLGAVAAPLAGEGGAQSRPGRGASTVRLSSEGAEAVGRLAAALFQGRPAPEPGLPDTVAASRGVVFLVARSGGERRAHAWFQAATGPAAVRGAVEAVRNQLTPGQLARVDVLELGWARDFRSVRTRRELEALGEVRRGLLGLELVHQGRAYRYAPTEFIAFNLGFARALERLAARAGVGLPVSGELPGPVRVFEADSLLVHLEGGAPRVTPLYRGNVVVPVEEVTRPLVERLAGLQAGWLLANLGPEGRLPYLYWPSRGEESPENNQLRQWMATRALGRLARARGGTEVEALADRNVRFNLARTYRETADGHGLILDRGDAVKLGAVALAWLALVEHPRPGPYAEQAAALLRTMDALWQPQGEFHTFWQPVERRGDHVNFYPGEALLAWAVLYQQHRDPERLARIERSLRFYRTWHRAQRNPAFVPWHTLACARLWAVTHAAEWRDWIFEMNDWLLGLQQWESQREFPDTMGRFYAPDRPFGPPHASSTGVYLEGLAAAWRVAREAGDSVRQETYRRAIMRGLRSLAQLTFKDEIDLFYVVYRERVRGGVRTTVYDNAIRVDNVQHSLLALLDILEAFAPEDFRP